MYVEIQNLRLVTGNPKTLAMMKLKSAGINETVFSFNNEIIGGFGDDGIQRKDLIQKALATLRQAQKSEPGVVLVIGDTPADIRGAHQADTLGMFPRLLHDYTTVQTFFQELVLPPETIRFNSSN